MFVPRLPRLALLVASLGSLRVSAIGAAAALQERAPQEAKNDTEFRKQASALINSYIPPDAWAAITPAVVSAANAAQVTGDPRSLFVSALEDEHPAPWFSSAIPSQYRDQIVALESAVDRLRPKDDDVPTPTDTEGAANTAGGGDGDGEEGGAASMVAFAGSVVAGVAAAAALAVAL